MRPIFKTGRGTLITAMLLCIALLAGCGGSPDSVQDPLSRYDTSVNALLPFATADPSLNTPSPTWTAQPMDTPPVVTAAPTPDGSYKDIFYGETGEAVSELQGRLKALGYYSGTMDSKYGDTTASAVRLFQSQLGVSVTGLASASLQKMLYSSTAPRYNAGNTGGVSSNDPYVDDADDDVDDFDPYVAPSATKKPSASTGGTSTNTGSGYKTLSTGAKGSAVRSLQQSLKNLGYYDGSVDGDYGSATVKAVKRFQKTYGQKQSGVATVAMQKKLFSGDAVSYKPAPTATPKPTAAAYKTLEWGSSGTAVKNLQARLNKLGYFANSANGTYGEKTVDAVMLFQKAIGADQTGVATVALQRRLFADDAPAAAKPKPTATPTPSTTTYKALKEGSSGSAVKRLQQRLKDLGYYSSKVTGGYGKNTTAAVKLFQKAVDVKQTGSASASLQKTLFSKDAPKYKSTPVTPAAEPTYKKLQKGSTGTAVKALQKRLKELGYFDGDIGGNYLSKTEAAVKAFQKALGVTQTGVATTDLQEKLFSSSAPMKGASKDDLKALNYKDTGEPVYQLQLRLIELGYMSDFESDEPSTYGKETRQAVIDAQLARGFDSDGNADLEFMRFIMSDKGYQISKYEVGG